MADVSLQKAIDEWTCPNCSEKSILARGSVFANFRVTADTYGGFELEHNSTLEDPDDPEFLCEYCDHVIASNANEAAAAIVARYEETHKVGVHIDDDGQVWLGDEDNPFDIPDFDSMAAETLSDDDYELITEKGFDHPDVMHLAVEVYEAIDVRFDSEAQEELDEEQYEIFKVVHAIMKRARLRGVVSGGTDDDGDFRVSVVLKLAYSEYNDGFWADADKLAADVNEMAHATLAVTEVEEGVKHASVTFVFSQQHDAEAQFNTAMTLGELVLRDGDPRLLEASAA